MVLWILKLLLLIILLIGVIWVKYIFISMSFKTLYNQFYYLKNMSFYNNYVTSESWVATQRLNFIANQNNTDLYETTANLTDLWSKLYTKIDTYSFIFQFSDLMVIDSEFETFYNSLLSEDNCKLISNLTVNCNDEFSSQIFANSFRSSMAYYFVLFKKFDVILQSTNATSIFTTHLPSIIDFSYLTNISYKLHNQKH
jgi:hypothetical protein